MKKGVCGFVFLLAAASACKKNAGDGGTTPPPPPPVVETAPLKSVATFPIAVSGSYGAFITNATSSGILKRDFNGITFENEMKNSSLVNGSGAYNFNTADAMVAAAQAAGIQIHGHVLAWHSQAQGAYYRSLLNAAAPGATNLAQNPGFENGDAASFTNFSVLNTGNPAGTATVTVGSGTAEVRSGSRSMKVVNPTAYNTDQWRVQVATDAIPLTVGKQYQVSYWVKAANANGSIRLSTLSPSSLYQADQAIGTSWQQVTWLITANEAQTRFAFDMGRNSNTYFIDDVSINEMVTAGGSGYNYAKVDSLLKTTIQTIAGHFKGKVRGWDVINEMFSDGPAGAIRNNTNTANATNNDVFVWSEYLGRDFGVKAFTYAAEADPDAKLFINDYNLEFSTAKLDSLIAYVEIRVRVAKVDGIGTQMHVSINTNKDAIDNHFKKLAATGLLVHVSELDIGVNTSNASSIVFTEALETTQAEMYNYIITSYMRNIPKPQRYGVTIWGLLDNQSWRYKNGADYPLIYNAAGAKKKAYEAVLNALKSGL
jgi:endo-1,4-beta-xylanase